MERGSQDRRRTSLQHYYVVVISLPCSDILVVAPSPRYNENCIFKRPIWEIVRYNTVFNHWLLRLSYLLRRFLSRLLLFYAPTRTKSTWNRLFSIRNMFSAGIHALASLLLSLLVAILSCSTLQTPTFLECIIPQANAWSHNLYFFLQPPRQRRRFCLFEFLNPGPLMFFAFLFVFPDSSPLHVIAKSLSPWTGAFISLMPVLLVESALLYHTSLLDHATAERTINSPVVIFASLFAVREETPDFFQF